jgi:hypothetical protein
MDELAAAGELGAAELALGDGEDAVVDAAAGDEELLDELLHPAARRPAEASKARTTRDERWYIRHLHVP